MPKEKTDETTEKETKDTAAKPKEAESEEEKLKNQQRINEIGKTDEVQDLIKKLKETQIGKANEKEKGPELPDKEDKGMGR